MGPYCRFCDFRCFVHRIMPADATWRPGQSVILATCQAGMKYDREHTGHDHTTAINPYPGDTTAAGTTPEKGTK